MSGLTRHLLRPASGAVLISLATACGAGPAGRTPAAPDPAAFPHDPELFTVLAMEPGMAQLDSLQAWESRRFGYEITDTLADVAENPAVHPLLRANAVLLVGRRHRIEDFIMLRPLLTADDPRIRLAVVAAAQEYLPVRTEAALAVLVDALRDTSDAVQARALEGIADRDVQGLREYVSRGPTAELAIVARGLIAAAEERGAPLERNADGTLRRTGPGGHELVYRATRSWSGGELSAGELQIVSATGAPVTLGDAIEVARDVVPAFFSNDGRFLVYEKQREIHVRDIAAGTERNVGPGIAPRPLPFTGDFVFARRIEEADRETGSETRLRYELRRLPFASGAEPAGTDIVGLVSTTSSFAVSGGASPVRWMRVAEKNGRFQLEGEGFDPVPLPDPFTGGPGS